MAAITRLGISIGTRTVGLAVSMYRELEEWQVKSFKDSWSKQKLIIICAEIKKMALAYKVQQVRIKLPTSTSAAVSELLSAIEVLFQKLSIAVVVLTLGEVKRLWGTDTNNKKELVAKVVQQHPFLQRLFVRSREGTSLYYIKLFEAVALVSTAL
jgi:RNase H-fold protein (predicted Holliday junction resolvase)